MKTAPAKPTFVFSQLPKSLPAPAKTAEAKYDLSDGRPAYIGGGVAFEATKADFDSQGWSPEWGLRLAGKDLPAAVAAAAELSKVPFKPYSNNDHTPTSVAVLQSKSGTYMLSTIWTTDFSTDTVDAVSIDRLKSLATKRTDLVAIVGPDSWLRRPEIQF